MKTLVQAKLIVARRFVERAIVLFEQGNLKSQGFERERDMAAIPSSANHGHGERHAISLMAPKRFSMTAKGVSNA
jgi:hypothetical protein